MNKIKKFNEMNNTNSVTVKDLDDWRSEYEEDVIADGPFFHQNDIDYQKFYDMLNKRQDILDYLDVSSVTELGDCNTSEMYPENDAQLEIFADFLSQAGVEVKSTTNYDQVVGDTSYWTDKENINTYKYFSYKGQDI